MLNASITLGTLRIQLLSESIVRIENKGPKGFEDRPSYIALNREDFPSVSYSIEKENRHQVFSGSFSTKDDSGRSLSIKGSSSDSMVSPDTKGNSALVSEKDEFVSVSLSAGISAGASWNETFR